jgi:hypothetical protein
MEHILREEEQISLLGKMLYYSARHLTSHEREVYDNLIESLVKKVNHIRELERKTHAAMGTPQVSQAYNQAKMERLKRTSPEEVCKIFVDAWNKQDFEIEFFCLSQNFPSDKKKSDDLHEYVLNRMKKYQSRTTLGPISKRVIEISSSDAHGNKASVYCIELHKMPDKDLTLHRRYELIYENGGWRIADFNTLKSHEVYVQKD